MIDTEGGFLRLRDVERLTGLSKSSIYRLEAVGEFVPRVKLSVRASGWPAHAVREWLNSRPRATQQPRAA